MIFGKYNGETIENIIERDINYIIWLLKNINDFELDKFGYLKIIKNRNKILASNEHILDLLSK